MIRLHIITEGPTEETFVNRILVPYLAQVGVYADAHCITTRRDNRRNRIFRGGLLDYRHVEKDIDLWVRQEQGRSDVWFTTMIDLYAFPKDTYSPYSETIQAIANPYTKVEALEASMRGRLPIQNFIPYVQLHEFEALVLCAPERLNLVYSERRTAIQHLCDEIEGLAPELINEGRETAPSKRIIRHIPEYEDQKIVAGILIAEDIGLPLLRQRCPHFNEWITRLEGLATL